MAVHLLKRSDARTASQWRSVGIRDMRTGELVHEAFERVTEGLTGFGEP
ncbi:hypothetical protein [Streptomyces sp. XY332]|nr:hypothetical protein [Streptomyces sp. XY332]